MKRYWHEVACKVLYNRREANTPNTKGNRHMRKQLASPWMRIALTLLLAGVIVQFTDFFEFFGHNSVIPLLIGLGMGARILTSPLACVDFTELVRAFSRSSSTRTSKRCSPKITS